MSDQTETELEARLRALSRWDDSPRGVWVEALKHADAESKATKRQTYFGSKIRVAAMIVLSVAGVLVLSMIGQGLGGRDFDLPLVGTPSSPSASWGRAAEMKLAPELAMATPKSDASGSGFPLPRIAPEFANNSRWRTSFSNGAAPAAALPEADASAPLPPPSAEVQRAVIRRASIDLTTSDVRATFLKARLLVSEVGGEYIESSSLTGTDQSLTASLTLRVRSARLSDVLNELRTLATVASESAGGEDVTTQVVDVEARLRNEQRVEKELLELLDTRKDSPLNEVLDLREKINEIRQGIERLTAQRDQLARLTSLATVLVIIRPDQSGIMPAAPGERPMWEYFKLRIAASYRNGLVFLSNTLAGLITVLVGGAFWWLLVIIAAFTARVLWRCKQSNL